MQKLTSERKGSGTILSSLQNCHNTITFIEAMALRVISKNISQIVNHLIISFGGGGGGGEVVVVVGEGRGKGTVYYHKLADCILFQKRYQYRKGI